MSKKTSKKARSGKRKPTKRKSAKAKRGLPPENDAERTPQLFDKLVKRLMRVSRGAVIQCINGLYDTDYPLDCPITYPNPVSVNPNLQERRADVLISVAYQGTHTHHTEAQTGDSQNLIVRMFEYDAAHAIAEAFRDIPVGATKVSEGVWTIDFPLSLVLRWDTSESSPDTLMLRIRFGGESNTCDYKVRVFKLLNFSVRELAEKGILILLPFCVLKFRHQVKDAQTVAEREQLAAQLQGIVAELIAVLEHGEQAASLLDTDLRDILAATNQLLDELYHPYTEFTEVRAMIDGIYELRSDKERKVERKQLEAERKQAEAERKQFEAKAEAERKQLEAKAEAERKQFETKLKQFEAKAEQEAEAWRKLEALGVSRELLEQARSVR